LSPRGQIEAIEDRRYVRFHGAFADEQFCRDFAIALTPCGKARHFEFAQRELARCGAMPLSSSASLQLTRVAREPVTPIDFERFGVAAGQLQRLGLLPGPSDRCELCGCVLGQFRRLRSPLCARDTRIEEREVGYGCAISAIAGGVGEKASRLGSFCGILCQRELIQKPKAELNGTEFPKRTRA
jgi:hypothetical protein